MEIVLVAGLWLPSVLWDDVVGELATYGHRAVPVRLPGQDDGATQATLEEQLAAVLAAVDAAADRPVVVGHSAASTLAWLAADRRPDKVARVVLIGGFPHQDGEPYATFFEISAGRMPFPGWDAFDEADRADLDAAARSRIESVAVPVPEGVARGVVRLRDPRRYDVPVTVACPEFTPAQAQEWIDGGECPELARAGEVDLVDLASGHWPMVSCPAELARLLASTG